MLDPELFWHRTVNQAQVTNGREERVCRGLEPSEAGHAVREGFLSAEFRAKVHLP